MQDRDTGIQPISPFEVVLGHLSTIEDLTPLEPKMLDVSLLRRQLTEAGFNMEVGDERRNALSKTKFRGYESGKGVAVAAIIGSEKIGTLEAKLLQLSAGGSRIVSQKTTSSIPPGSTAKLYRFLINGLKD